jgi:hypothetical protein
MKLVRHIARRRYTYTKSLAEQPEGKREDENPKDRNK